MRVVNTILAEHVHIVPVLCKFINSAVFAEHVYILCKFINPAKIDLKLMASRAKSVTCYTIAEFVMEVCYACLNVSLEVDFATLLSSPHDPCFHTIMTHSPSASVHPRWLPQASHDCVLQTPQMFTTQLKRHSLICQWL